MLRESVRGAIQCDDEAKLTQDAEAEVEGHHDHLAVGGEHGAVVGCPRVPLQRLAVDVDDDGQARGPRRRCNSGGEEESG